MSLPVKHFPFIPQISETFPEQTEIFDVEQKMK